ncbi:hypothetical protein [Kosmotoga pacifica]|uniref:Uncharacterized protein n=1 Tax=Kosmotoga pacifica TaxID=1330330 RepID=A0A0G2Z918_9BACT|nr:hypothetical protein [Kosmotoga pacifica]AKI96566.1 hypothetical protein IX53_00600 [Kosmotoga pacifica]
MEELSERIEYAQEIYVELLKRGHNLLAEKVQGIIEDLQEDLENEWYIGQYGIWGWLGLSEKSFM